MGKCEHWAVYRMEEAIGAGGTMEARSQRLIEFTLRHYVEVFGRLRWEHTGW